MKRIIAILAVCAFAGPQAQASFHLMQIEQIIGRLPGNPLAQAIQLRQRAGGQNLVSQSSLWAADAAGENRILLLNITSNVANNAGGSRILLTTTAFNAAMNSGGPAFTPDFTLTNPIPESYLAAGRLTFENDAGTIETPGQILWSLAWGGDDYTGSHIGSATNDADGNFGPAFPSALPTNGQGVLFNGLFSAPSTTNLANYVLSASPATVVRNNGTSFTVVPEPATLALLALGGLALTRRRR